MEMADFNQPELRSEKYTPKTPISDPQNEKFKTSRTKGYISQTDQISTSSLLQNGINSSMCSIDSSTNHDSEFEMDTQQVAVPEDPLIDFNRRKLRRRQKRLQQQESDAQNFDVAACMSHEVPDSDDNETLGNESSRSKFTSANIAEKPVIERFANKINVCKDTFKIWTSVENQPLDFSSKRIKLTFQPLNLCRITDKGDIRSTDAHKPIGEQISKEDSTGSGEDKPESVSDKSCQNLGVLNGGDNDDLKENSSEKKIILKPAKFLLNGAVCYLIPANMFMNSSHQKESAIPTSCSEESNHKIRATSVQKSSNGLKSQSVCTSSLLTPVSKPIDADTSASDTRPNFQHFTIYNTLLSPENVLKSISKCDTQRRRLATYPSIQMYNSNRTGTPRIRISRLGRSTFAPQNTGQGSELRDESSQVADWFCNNSNEDQQRFLEVSNDSQRKLNDANGSHEHNPSRVSKYIIVSPKSGTLFFLDDDNHAFQRCSIVNNERAINEPPDQLVPNLDDRGERTGLSRDLDKSGCKKRSYSQERRDYLTDLGDLVHYGKKLSEIETVLYVAAYIKNLKKKIEESLLELGAIYGTEYLERCIPALVVKDQIHGYQMENSKFCSINPNSFTTTESLYNASHVVDHGNTDFLVPQQTNSYLESSNSPLLNVSEAEVWAPESGHSEAGTVDRNPQLLVNRSSQVSFSDSFTDDSEAVHEFDLNFADSGKCEGETKRIFEAYIDELLENYYEFNSTQQDLEMSSCNSSQETQYSSQQRPSLENYPNLLFQNEIFMSPVPRMQPGSPILSTPPQFSVSNLASDILHGDEASLNPDQLELSADATIRNYFFHALALKVERKCKQQMTEGPPDQDRNLPDRLVPDVSQDANETESNKAAAMLDRQNENVGLGGSNSRTILAKDLIKSDLLTSFLYPNPVLIPEDPFGIGAETLVGDKADDVMQETWQNVNLTPPQRTRPITGMPPALKKKRKGHRKRKTENKAVENDARPQKSKSFKQPKIAVESLAPRKRQSSSDKKSPVQRKKQLAEFRKALASINANFT